MADDQQIDETKKRSLISRIGFGLVNAWLVFHLFSIIAAPSSVMPSSRFSQASWEVAAPYLQLMYLNHGFHYFSPEPGAATTIGYELEFEDGSKETGVFPNKNIQPRLLYHRHFMLTEFQASDVPEDRKRQEIWFRAFARNLCRRSGAVSVKLSKIKHFIATQEWILAGGKLSDPEMFSETELGTWKRSEL